MKSERSDYDIILRRDLNQILIWSKKLSCYLMPATEIAKQFINSLFENHKTLFEIDKEFSPSFIQDIGTIGFSNKIRKLNFSQFEFIPLDVYFDYTHNCNYNCSYCYNKSSKMDVTMSKKNISKVIFELWKHGIIRLHLAGGEPTIYKDNLLTYIETSNKYQLCTSLTTNGLFDDDSILESLIFNNIYSMTYSLHGYSLIMNDAFSKKFVSNIKKTISLKNKYNSNILINLKPVWNNKTNITDIEQYINMAVELGVNSIKLSNPEKNILYFQDKNYRHFYYEKLKEIIILKEKYHNQINIILVSNPFLNKTVIGIPGRFGCIGGQELITIMPDSSITPCAINKTKLGNLFDDYNGDLSYFLASPIWRNYMVNIQDNIKKSECKTCELLLYCRGGSQFRANSIKLKFDILCPKKNINKLVGEEIQIQAPSLPNKLHHFQVINVCHSL